MSGFIIDVKDVYSDFIIEKMREIDSNIYNDNDFNIYINTAHENVLYIDNGKIIAFCVIILTKDKKMAYSWCDGTINGKKAYIRGINMVLKRYNVLGFGAGALKLNKIRRLLHE